MVSGAPDYVSYNRPQRTTYGLGQTPWEAVLIVTVSGNSAASGTVYTVPAGKRLFILTGLAATDQESVSYSYLARNGSPVVPFTMLRYYLAPMSESGSIVFNEGDTVDFYTENGDNVARNGYASMFGVLEDV